MKKSLLVLAAAAALASSATAAAASSPAAYRTQVNGICARGVAQINAVPGPKTAAGLYQYFKKVATLSDALLVKVANVTPPASLVGPVTKAVKLQAVFQVALNGLVAKLRTSSNPQKTVQSARASLDSLNNKANKAWLAAGLVKCGS